MNEIIPRTLLTDICAARDASVATMERALSLMAEGLALAEEAERLAHRAHGASTFPLEDRAREDAYRRIFSPVNAAQSQEVWRQQVDARTWVQILTLTGMQDLMDRQAKEELYKKLGEHVQPVSEQVVRDTLESLRGDAPQTFKRGLARVFITLDRRFRSHDGFKIGDRIILTRAFDEWGNWTYWSKVRDQIIDVERIFSVLDGQAREAQVAAGAPAPRSLVQAIEEDRGRGLNPRQSVTEGTYFRIRTYKNGNAHLWFTRDDLVARANALLAEYYGEVLPDGVPADVTPGDIRNRSTALVRDLQFYRTPQDVVERILGDVYIRPGDRVLEPSAGDGAIVRELLRRGASVEAVEVDPGRARALRDLLYLARGAYRVCLDNFLTMPPRPAFDYVVMNPPFYGTHWMQHVMHAADFLAPGGALIAVLPVSAELGESRAHEAFRAWVAERRGIFRDLPLESFASSGTRISTVYLTVHRSR